MSDEVLWWLIGGICFIAGMSSFTAGNYRIALEQMGLGLVFIAVGSKEVRIALSKTFLSIFEGLWTKITNRL